MIRVGIGTDCQYHPHFFPERTSMSMHHHDKIRAIEWSEEGLKLLDQRLLPGLEQWVTLKDATGVAQAIRDMVVRGAPAIGVTAAYGVVLAARDRYAESAEHWKNLIEADFEVLAESRPTAVNLFWALERMKTLLAGIEGDPVETLLDEAKRLHNDDIAANRRMGELGAALIEGPCAVLTHCNTGSLATGGFGTALGVIRAAFTEGRVNHVFADETRPWLQGARLTAWELVEDNIPVTLLAEGAAATLMNQGKVKWVIVGSDRIAANGDVANKIGTYSLAVNARHHGVKFMVVAPTSTVDMAIASGEQIPIEERPQEEVLSLAGKRIAPAAAHAWNPSFDVTPAELVDAIVTEKGVVLAPTPEKMKAMMAE
jgi:methylthioribose-1-phosphate isomerase